MSLAKDELVGVIVAAVVAVAALADFAYRQGKGKGTAPAAAVEAPRPPAPDDQHAREEFAVKLAAAFAQDQNPALVTVDATTLKIRWEMCSKQMLQRLLHDDKNYQVQNIRQLSGISVPELKAHGFKRVECDDGRQGLKPATEAL